MTDTDRAVLRARAYLELLRREREWHKAECPGYHCCPDESEDGERVPDIIIGTLPEHLRDKF